MSDDDLCKYLDWDSNFFGLRIGRITANRLYPDMFESILAWRDRHSIDCFYFLADADNDVTIRLAEEYQFHFVDIRTTLEKKIDKAAAIREVKIQSVNVRPVRLDDIPTLLSIARTSYHDSRFYFDSRFPKDKCDLLYETWVEKSCNGYADAVLVADINGIPAGFISCHLVSQSEGKIGLVGVGPNFQGRGVGQTLVMESLRWFAERVVDRVTIVTQGRNIKAQRLYQKCGLSIQSLQLWYHWWSFARAVPLA